MNFRTLGLGFYHLTTFSYNFFSVSRSFPFISKTWDFDFVALATKAMMYNGEPSEFEYPRPQAVNKVGVKVGYRF